MLFRLLLVLAVACGAFAQQPPYDKPPSVEPPYHRARYEASTKPGELIFPVQYTLWVPPGVQTLRGVIVHQHGCGEGSCLSGQTGAFDLHWQALAAKHDCALLSPSYEQPEGAECQMWCDPRNGSDSTFRRALADLGKRSDHPELATAPWALWGHSGGGHWAGGMVMLHPDRVVAAWLRSGVPLLSPNPDRANIQPHSLPDEVLRVPLMCNLGAKEGVTDKTNRFAGVWPANETFFRTVRGKGGLVGVAVDPLSSHECGNQRYLAIPWLDACLTARLPARPDDPLKPMPTAGAWLAPMLKGAPIPAVEVAGNGLELGWLPNEALARAWTHYVSDTSIPDTTPPPAPSAVRVSGNQLTWQGTADLESGLSHFIIIRDGERIAQVPDQPTNRFGRPLFQGLQYSDTPAVPLVEMRFTDATAPPATNQHYQVIAVNTVGLESVAAAAGH